jgi:hypothetical protein
VSQVASVLTAVNLIVVDSINFTVPYLHIGGGEDGNQNW